MKVMIVDDHEVVRDGLALLLQDFFDIDGVVFASEGREAIQHAFHYPLDLVLLDLSMPEGLDGMETARELRRIMPDAKIVVFSMFDEEAYQRKAFQIGVDGYLVKNQKGEDVIQNLQKILDGQKVFDQKILDEDETQGGESDTPWDLPITPREKEVFIMTVLGHSQKEIAEKLSISVKTVENHRRNISKKLGSHKRSDWLELARKYNVLELY